MKQLKILTLGLVIVLGLVNWGCSSSKHYTKKVLLKHPLTGEEYVVEQDIIEQTGIIKAKHPTGAEGESRPWIEMPNVPVRYEP
jgi:hypothetical protein